MEYHKLAFVGDVGSGKTTIIRTLSDISTVNTDRSSSVDIGKAMTTVGIDYGRIMLGDTMALGLYGVPGQTRFSAVWRHVAKSLWGLAFLVKYVDEPDLGSLEPVFDFFDPSREGTPFVIALTHTDGVDRDDVRSVATILKTFLRQRDLVGSVLPVDCRDRHSSISIPLFLNALGGSA